MAKTLTIQDNGTTYTLEFTRKSIETMERQGFKISDIEDKPVTTLPALFAGAFLANHRYVKREVIDRIFGRMTKRNELIGKLAEMYNEPLLAMMDEPEESEGNLDWETSW